MSDPGFIVVILFFSVCSVVGMLTLCELLFNGIDKLVRMHRARAPFWKRMRNVECAAARNQRFLERLHARMKREAEKARASL